MSVMCSFISTHSFMKTNSIVKVDLCTNFPFERYCNEDKFDSIMFKILSSLHKYVITWEYNWSYVFFINFLLILCSFIYTHIFMKTNSIVKFIYVLICLLKEVS